MSKFLSNKYSELEQYVPGEQPKDGEFIKLNTNELAFSPSPEVLDVAKNAAENLQLYPDPDALKLRTELAESFRVEVEQVFVGNGSDEVLNLAFGAFCDSRRSAVFPDITYGFYPVFAQYNQASYREIPLRDDLSIKTKDYMGLDPQNTGAIIIANPNAPTGIALGLEDIEIIVKSNPNIVVIIDEAYVDFGAKSALCLINEYDNLLIVQTFSKSKGLAGARIGFAFAQNELISDLNTIRYATNPYNVNTMTQSVALAVLKDSEYTQKCLKEIIEVREYELCVLRDLGFIATDSLANFVFVRHPSISGKELYEKLKSRNILVRHFGDQDRTADYVRITVGTREQTDILIRVIKEILSEKD